MTADVSIELHGLREIQAKLQQLPARIARKAVYSALRKGAAVVRKEIAKTAPVRTGTLRKGFRVGRSRFFRGPEKFGVFLTLKKGKGRNDPSDPFYGRWVESGYRAGKKTVTVRVARADRPGRTRNVRRGEHEIPGQFFVQRAFDASASAAVAAIVAEADDKSQRAITELGL